MSQALIRVENLTKTYRSGATDLTVFSGLGFELRSGESVAVTGESGAGKSTLLHLLGALDLPTTGEIYFESRPLSAFSEAEVAAFRNRDTGFVWQNYYLLPEFTAIENVMMPLVIGGADLKEAEAPARRWLQQVGLAERVSHRAGELSGGEQQRVTIARALVTTPKLLLADEPTGNLDQRTGEAIIDLIVSLPGSHRLAVVIATHNMAFARRCNRIFRIECGEVLEVSTAR